MKLDISIRVAVEHVLAQKFKESVKWVAQVANINEYVRVTLQNQEIFSGRMP